MDLQGEIMDFSSSVYIQGAKITERVEIQTINGIRAGKLNAIKYLYFEDSTVNYIPSGLHKFFPQLYELNVDSSGLKEISSDDLFGLNNLEYLWLLDNDLKSLPDDLFVHTKNLRAMTVRGNKLEHLSWHLFDPLTFENISRMDFDNNPKIDVCYDKYQGLEGWARLKSAMDLSAVPIDLNKQEFSELYATTFTTVIRNCPIRRAFWEIDPHNPNNKFKYNSS